MHKPLKTDANLQKLAVLQIVAEMNPVLPPLRGYSQSISQYLSSGDYSLAFVCIENANRQFPTDSAQYQASVSYIGQYLIDFARKLVTQGRYEAVMPIIGQIQRWTSDGSPMPFPLPEKMKFIGHSSFLKGCVQMKNGHYEDAAQSFIMAASNFEAASLVSELLVAYLSCAEALLEMNQNEEAFAQAKSALDLLSSPECDQSLSPTAFNVIALAALKCGKTEDAESFLKKSVLGYSHEGLMSKLVLKSEKSEIRPRSQPIPERPQPPAEVSEPHKENARSRFRRAKHEQSGREELALLGLSISKLSSICKIEEK